jgi:hypothetical protein
MKRKRRMTARQQKAAARAAFDFDAWRAQMVCHTLSATYAPYVEYGFAPPMTWRQRVKAWVERAGCKCPRCGADVA